jgi:hypothetical protein
MILWFYNQSRYPISSRLSNWKAAAGSLDRCSSSSSGSSRCSSSSSGSSSSKTDGCPHHKPCEKKFLFLKIKLKLV